MSCGRPGRLAVPPPPSTHVIAIGPPPDESAVAPSAVQFVVLGHFDGIQRRWSLERTGRIHGKYTRVVNRHSTVQRGEPVLVGSHHTNSIRRGVVDSGQSL